MYTELEDIRAWLERIADDFGFPSNLSGLCGVSAGKVHLRMKKLGYKSRIICNKWHCFNLVNGQLVDCTASQFNLPDIYIGPFPDSRWFYSIEKVFKTARELFNWQRRQDWCESQILDRYIKKAHRKIR